jgi:hypothetical protein
VIINDGVYSSFTTSEQIPIAQFIAANQQTLGVNASQVATWQNLSVACGYQAVLDQVVRYSPLLLAEEWSLMGILSDISPGGQDLAAEREHRRLDGRVRHLR